MSDTQTQVPILYMVPTPLAEDTHFAVLTPQIIEVLKSCPLFFCENLRTSRRLISSLKLGIVIDTLEMHELDKPLVPAKIIEYIDRIVKSKGPACMLSEAGCPGIADPGAELVAAAHKRGIKVVPLAGPNSMTLALMGSGFSGQRYTFNGYLPIDPEKRSKAITALYNELKRTGTTQLFMETPFRNNSVIKELLKTLPPEQLLCIASDLTGKGEVIETHKVADWKLAVPDRHKIPTIFAIGL
jgi:16S rRNA (cytidine1402-2'-O)-methyltransferase